VTAVTGDATGATERSAVFRGEDIRPEWPGLLSRY
jgi:hypothetical protein